MNEQEAWERRHVALFRTHRGHDACTVPGCIGGQPLQWVQTRAEWMASLGLDRPRRFPSRAIDFPSPHLAQLKEQLQPGRAYRDHTHWPS